MAWYNASWNYRVKITVDYTKVDATLSNFPVYVDLNDLPSHFWDNVKNSGGDIRITTSDEETEVAREVVSCDTSTDTGELHFKAPSLSHTADTEFYIYYGNSGASEPAVDATYGRNNVWSNGYLAVYHLNESPTTTTIDSTGNGKSGTSAGSMSSDDLVNGKIGKGISFDGSNDTIAISDSGGDFQKNELTISAWVSRKSSQTGRGS
jgi:hypothetical protein